MTVPPVMGCCYQQEDPWRIITEDIQPLASCSIERHCLVTGWFKPHYLGIGTDIPTGIGESILTCAVQ